MTDTKEEELTVIAVSDYLSPEDWSLIREDGQDIFKGSHIEDKGAEFLIAFFHCFPHHQQYFKAFKGLSLKELKSLPFAHNHGRSVITRLGLVVDNLDNPREVKVQMQKLISAHVPRGVKVADMKDILDVFIQFVQHDRGARFGPDHVLAWRKLVLYLQAVLEAEATSAQTELLSGCPSQGDPDAACG
ncbi:hypothetical protein BsWGS_11267 [Bradybaena similaris]